MAVKNLYTTRPSDLGMGDVLICTVVCYIDKWDGNIIAKIYRAEYPSHEQIPQGAKVAEVVGIKSRGYEALQTLFPVVTWAMNDDP